MDRSKMRWFLMNEILIAAIQAWISMPWTNLKAFQTKAKLVKELDGLSPDLLALPEAEQASLDTDTRYLIEIYPFLPMIRDLEFATVISGDHNDPESWKSWTDKENQVASITRFKRRLASEKTEAVRL